MTTVKHEEYWPAILADPTQYGQIQTADAAWNARAACVFEVLKNTLCARDNAILTQQWENTLALSPADGATLNERKAVILYRLTEAPPLTIALLEKSLILLMGEGKAVVEHLPAENKLVVHTDRADDTQLEAVTALLERVVPQGVEVERYNHHIEVSWRDANKYAFCTNAIELCAVSPEKVVIENYGFGGAVYTTDFTSDGQFGYPIPKMTSLNTSGFGGSVFAKTPAELFRISAPALTAGGRCIRHINNSKEIYLDAPLVDGFQENYNANMEKFWCNSKNLTKIYNAFDAPKLRVIECDFSKLDNGERAFLNSVFEKESALRVLNGIPAWSDDKAHLLRIGIHVDHKNDEEVLAAIANAEAKGWTLTVQWNGTPTAQAATTYGLRKPPIYAKMSEMERPDGTTERVLDWGHYVTDPTGYAEFASVEEAREHYGLPAEDEAKEETTE